MGRLGWLLEFVRWKSKLCSHTETAVQGEEKGTGPITALPIFRLDGRVRSHRSTGNIDVSCMVYISVSRNEGRGTAVRQRISPDYQRQQPTTNDRWPTACYFLQEFGRIFALRVCSSKPYLLLFVFRNSVRTQPATTSRRKCGPATSRISSGIESKERTYCWTGFPSSLPLYWLQIVNNQRTQQVLVWMVFITVKFEKAAAHLGNSWNNVEK